MNVAKAARAMLAVNSAEHRATQYDWKIISNELSDFGCARIERLISPDECREIAGTITRTGI